MCIWEFKFEEETLCLLFIYMHLHMNVYFEIQKATINKYWQCMTFNVPNEKYNYKKSLSALHKLAD